MGNQGSHSTNVNVKEPAEKVAKVDQLCLEDEPEWQQIGNVTSFGLAVPRKTRIKAFQVIVIDHQKRTKQPFPRLPSFPVAGTLLSYYGYKDQSFELLQQLSVVSRRYFTNHEKFLVHFLVRRPPPRTLPYFKFFRALTNTETHRGFSWPKAQDLRIDAITAESLWGQRLRIVKIELEHDCLAMLSIQAFISHRVGTCFKFEVQPSKNKDGKSIETKKVSSPELDREIGRIGLKVSCMGCDTYCGVKLFDRHNELMFESQWDIGRWEYQDVPQHKTAVGFHGYSQIDGETSSKQNYIQRLGLVVLRQ